MTPNVKTSHTCYFISIFYLFICLTWINRSFSRELISLFARRSVHTERAGFPRGRRGTHEQGGGRGRGGQRGRVGAGWTQEQNLHHPASRFHPHPHHRHIRRTHQVGNDHDLDFRHCLIRMLWGGNAPPHDFNMFWPDQRGLI